MSYIANLGEAVGKGFVSAFKSIEEGYDRTKIDLGFDGSHEAIESIKDKVSLVEEIYLIVKNHKDEISPAYNIITTVLKNYYDVLPPALLEHLAKQVGVYSAYYLGRKILARELATYVAREIILRATDELSVLGLFKAPTKLGEKVVKVGNIAITFFMINSIFDNSSKSALYLRVNFPQIYLELKQKKLEMLFFLVRKPLQKYLNTILLARKYSRTQFARMIYRKWNLPYKGL